MWMSVQTAPVMWMRTATTCPAPLSVPVDLVSLETVYNVSVSKEQRYQSINLWWVGEVLEELIFYILSLSVGEVRLCGDDVCHPNARCVFNSDIGRPMCECNSGYYGDGKNCTTLGLLWILMSNKTWSLRSYWRIVFKLSVRYLMFDCFSAFECNEAPEVCHQDAQCIYDFQEQRYKCECGEGFSGDGLVCQAYKDQCDRCHANATCVFNINTFTHTCQCNPGFTGDGRYCSLIGQYFKFKLCWSHKKILYWEFI